MITAEVVTDLRNIRALQNVAVVLPDAIERFVKRDIRPFVSQQVDRRLRHDVPRPRQKGDRIDPWTSEKQRKAFFATNGFGKGIPYKRTGQLVNAWHVRGDYTRGFSGVSIYNESPYAQYVYGDDRGKHQQLFHRNWGWPNYLDNVQLIRFETQERIDKGLQSVINEALHHG